MAKRLILLLPASLLLAAWPGSLWAWHWYEPAARKNQQGIEAYRREKYSEALERFLSAKGLKAGALELENNTAAALYQLKKYQEAADEFSRIDTSKLGAAAAAAVHYNLGNAYYRLGRYPQALESYKRGLLLDPDDVQGKKNYELTLKKIQEQQQQKPEQNPQQDDQAEAERQKQKYSAMMQFLNQNERKQMERKKRKATAAHNEKDW
jgi:Ca-activated chloride channel family protein